MERANTKTTKGGPGVFPGLEVQKKIRKYNPTEKKQKKQKQQGTKKRNKTEQLNPDKTDKDELTKT